MEAPRPPRRGYNADDVRKTRKYSLGILNLIGNATKREVKTDYFKISVIYHPDKHRLASTIMSPNQGEGHFKLVNNAYKFLRMNA